MLCLRNKSKVKTPVIPGSEVSSRKSPVTAEATLRERIWCGFSIIFQTQACIMFYGPSILKQTLDQNLQISFANHVK